MKIASVLLPMWFVGLLTACESSSNNSGGASTDAGADGQANDAVPSCLAFGPPACGIGKVCCFTGLSGICLEPSACRSTVRFECEGPTGCDAGEVCCASVPFDQPIDASALTPEGGLGALGITATSVCASSCSSPNISFCRTPADCPAGATCHALPEGNPILLVLGGETFGACALLDGGTSPPPEDGALDGSDSARDASDAPSSD